MKALDDQDLSIVQAAIEGLGRQRSEAAAQGLESLVVRTQAQQTRGILAMAELKAMPAALARKSLQRLAGMEDVRLQREASYGLADLGDLTVVPFLLNELESDRQHRRAVTKLQYLLCKDFGKDLWRYRSFFEADPNSNHGDFFFQALLEVGHNIAAGTSPLEASALPVLLAALEDERWFVRRCAMEFLEESTGQRVGTLSVSATTEEIEDMTRRWREVVSGLALKEGGNPGVK
jgi:hypothetical protein